MKSLHSRSLSLQLKVHQSQEWTCEAGEALGYRTHIQHKRSIICRQRKKKKRWCGNTLPVCWAGVWSLYVCDSQWWFNEVLLRVEVCSSQDTCKVSKGFWAPSQNLQPSRFSRSHLPLVIWMVATLHVVQPHKNCSVWELAALIRLLKGYIYIGNSLVSSVLSHVCNPNSDFSPLKYIFHCISPDFCKLFEYPPPYAAWHTPKVTVAGMLEGQTRVKPTPCLSLTQSHKLRLGDNSL